MYEKTIKHLAMIALATAIGYFGVLAIVDWPNISQRTMGRKVEKPRIMLALNIGRKVK